VELKKKIIGRVKRYKGWLIVTKTTVRIEVKLPDIIKEPIMTCCQCKLNSKNNSCVIFGGCLDLVDLLITGNFRYSEANLFTSIILSPERLG
jgi:hypothetical protein